MLPAVMPKNRFGLPEPCEVVGRAPVRLRDDADAEALRFQHAADDRHAEARVIDVGVAGHDDDVAAVPAERVHLLPRHGQERGGPEAGRPVFAIGEQFAGGKHGARMMNQEPPRCRESKEGAAAITRGRHATADLRRQFRLRCFTGARATSFSAARADRRHVRRIPIEEAPRLAAPSPRRSPRRYGRYARRAAVDRPPAARSTVALAAG